MKILIVDDEKPARDRLRQLIADIGMHEVVGEAANGEQALALASTLDPDIVLLDIRMPGVGGIATAHHLNALESPPAVVFTTAYDEYAVDAFEARAIGYVLKPVRKERLNRALEHAAQVSGKVLNNLTSAVDLQNRRRHVCARVHGELRLIPLRSVYYFSADQKYVSVHHDKGQDLIDESLKSLETEFADAFVRIHRGALVAVDKITALEKNAEGKTRIVLREDAKMDDNELQVSRRHLTEVRRRLKGQ